MKTTEQTLKFCLGEEKERRVGRGLEGQGRRPSAGVILFSKRPLKYVFGTLQICFLLNKLNENACSVHPSCTLIATDLSTREVGVMNAVLGSGVRQLIN